MRDIEEVSVTEVTHGFVILDVTKFNKDSSVKSQEMFALFNNGNFSGDNKWQFRSLEHTNNHMIGSHNSILDAIDAYHNEKTHNKEFKLYFVNKLTELR